MNKGEDVQVILSCGHTTHWPLYAALNDELRWCTPCQSVQKCEQWFAREWRARCEGYCRFARWYGQARPARVPHTHPVVIEYVSVGEKTSATAPDDGTMTLFDDMADDPPPF